MKIKDLCSYAPKSKIKAGEAVDNAEYMFFTSSADENKRYIDFQYNQEAIIMGTGGNATLHYYNGKFSVSTDCLVLLPSSQIKCKYLYYFFKSHMKVLEAGFKGAGLKHTNKKYVEEIEINEVPNLITQEKIIYRLDKVMKNIEKLNKELELFDSLVKARFVEMFGDPGINSMNWTEELIGDSCFVTKLAGFEYTQYIHYGDTGDVVMVKAQNVKNGKLNRKDLSYISSDVSNLLPRSQLAAGDVVMTYVGANIGDVAVIDDECKYHLAPNVAKIRPDAEKYNSLYFMYMLMFLNSYIVGNSADTAKAALGMERIRKLKIFAPPIDLQEQFAAFVKQVDKSKLAVQKSLERTQQFKQVDKSKLAVQKSLERTQQLFDSLMQEYFG